MVLNLREEEKEALVRAISYYYENQVWENMVINDEVGASDEDYRLRAVRNKLDLKFPSEISSRF